MAARDFGRMTRSMSLGGSAPHPLSDRLPQWARTANPRKSRKLCHIQVASHGNASHHVLPPRFGHTHPLGVASEGNTAPSNCSTWTTHVLTPAHTAQSKHDSSATVIRVNSAKKMCSGVAGSDSVHICHNITSSTWPAWLAPCACPSTPTQPPPPHPSSAAETAPTSNQPPATAGQQVPSPSSQPPSPCSPACPSSSDAGPVAAPQPTGLVALPGPTEEFIVHAAHNRVVWVCGAEVQTCTRKGTSAAQPQHLHQSAQSWAAALPGVGDGLLLNFNSWLAVTPDKGALWVL